MPVIRQQKFLYVLPQIVVMVLLSIPFYFLDKYNFMLYGLLVFFVLFYALRTLVPRHHRQGIKYYKKQDYALAIDCFQKSYDFFKRNAFVDKYRFILLLSSSRISYAEMANVNVAFCLSQLGKKAEAIAKYREVLAEFPESQMAMSALRMLEP
jgi:tetratricopeptide (TPR) repeat protein